MRQLLCYAIIFTAIYLVPFQSVKGQQSDTIPRLLTLEDAAALLHNNNRAIQIAQEGIKGATAEKQQLNATWYPFISASGGYIHTSNNISAKANLGNLASDIIGEFPSLGQLLPQLEQIITSLGSITLSIPLLEQNLTTIDAIAVWPIITGGKRIYASRIGNNLEQTAEHLYTSVYNTQMALMINAYYTLKLANQVARMQQENLQYMEKLHTNASRLKEEGFINKAEYLVVLVAKEEATREFESSKENCKVALMALNTILGTNISALPCSPFLLPDSTSSINYNNLILTNNAQLKILHTQQEITENRKKIAIADYFPNIALVARQNLYSHNIPSNLLPRSMAGATFQWNIFNGLYREKEIQKTNITQRELQLATKQTEMELITAASSLQSKMEDARYNISTLNLTVKLTKELLREREKSFAEGMCTSTEVVDAKTGLLKAETALTLAHWQYNASLANLLALCSNTEQFIEMLYESKQ